MKTKKCDNCGIEITFDGSSWRDEYDGIVCSNQCFNFASKNVKYHTPVDTFKEIVKDNRALDDEMPKRRNKMNAIEFVGFPKIARLKRECVISEKIDGTNAQVCITEEDEMFVGSKNRWITPEDDNYGFAAWCQKNKDELMTLGHGRHFGEWWGSGIQRRYDMTGEQKFFSLFNTSRWSVDENLPDCCSVVPVLYCGMFSVTAVDDCLRELEKFGSTAAPGFMEAEGVVTYLTAGRTMYKTTIKKDEEYKGKRG